MATRPSYIEILNEYFPDISVSSSGDAYDYAALTLNDPSQTMPTQEELDSKSLYMTRKAVWSEIQDMRDTRKSSGVKVGTDWFHSDDTSRIQQLALSMMGANMPTGIMWKTMTGTFVEMKQSLAMAIFSAVAGSDQKIYAQAEYHRQHMILDTQDPTTYDYSTGWPMIYSESPEAAALVDYQ